MNPTTRGPRRGDIAVAPFPHTDLSEAKRRPVLVLANTSRGDILVAFITSQPQPESFENVVIGPPDEEFAMTGLVTRSTIRIGRLATISTGVVAAGRLGRVGPKTESRVFEALRRLLHL